jgi:type IV pilus assembly protein PilM
LKKISGGARLVTYGYSEDVDFSKDSKSSIEDNLARNVEVLLKICERAGVKSHEAVAALPSFSVFSSIINLPNIGAKDVPSAIGFEAKKIIPLPLEEMILDWKEIGFDQKNSTRNYLLTGAPKALVNSYVTIFRQAKINLVSLETETFSLVRSLLGNDRSVVMIVEVGSSTTDITIVEDVIPTLSRSIDLGGRTISKAISNTLKVGLERAEQFKYDMGIGTVNSQNDVIPKTVLETISPIINEIKYSMNLFHSKSERKVEKIILSGGSSLLPNLPAYLSRVLDMQVYIGNPWGRVAYPSELKPVLDEIAPKMSVAVGLALRQM